MQDLSLDFLIELVNTPSPSGYEERVAELYRQRLAPIADSVTTDLHGNVIAAIHPEAPMRIMLAGHMDEIGFVIHYVNDEGLLFFKTVGGHDPTMMVGQRVWVHTANGPIAGVIGRKAIHLLTDEEKKRRPDVHDLWIDIGVSTREHAERLVELGDPVTYQWEFQQLVGTLATARGFDNKMGTFIVAEALRLIRESGRLDPNVGVFAVATVQEEIGLRGAKTAAYGINPQVGIAVDVNHANDTPGILEQKYGRLYVGKGPSVMRGANASPVVFREILAAAKAENLPYQVDVEAGGTGTDGNAMQVNRAGMAVGIMGVPLRYMHSPCEVLDLMDIEHCAKLMAAFCLRVTATSDFTPRPQG
ncbi:MAG: M42 family metallopeptidase [Fimbriimonadaceae bacterium]|nr:M42 family metallopeptidase [Fimbriimonadaceae bacterium]